ncbi:excisionase [Shewanella sp. A32]|uniref:excisionase n=1 Tax=Shewanella sp. A32 TaxID=3031327 RepID=UPI0023BA07AA|nr:excisionase [Shewanella sp. A32]MDF0533645.1 excisionase [Shewanella sp. A32]
MDQYTTLEDWAQQHIKFPVSTATLRAWAKSGCIIPKPVKLGRRWAVKTNAIYVDPSSRKPANDIQDDVVRRILNGSKAS